MAFTPSSFQDLPSTATPITAAEMNKLGTQHAQVLTDIVTNDANPASTLRVQQDMRLDATFAPLTVVTVGPSDSDFTQPQGAIDSITDDSADKPYMIVLAGGTYERFSMVGWPNQTGDWTQNRRRFISMRPLSPLDEVTILDATGDYRTPPAEIRTVGTIQRITFLATHDVPFSDATEAALARRSYAIHMDFGDQAVIFEDCDLISHHAPAAGIGFHNQESITFRRTRLQNLGDGSFGGLADYGALFAHSGSGSNNVGQYLTLEDCWIFCPNGSRKIWISVSGDFVGCEMTVTAIRNVSYGPGIVERDSRIRLTPGSANNNDAALNAAAVAAAYTGLSLPGTTTNYAMTADAARLDITGDIEIVWYGSLVDWTSGAVQGLLSKYETSGNNRSYALAVSQVGRPLLSWTTNGLGSTQVLVTGTAGIPAVDGSAIWLKATLDVNNGAGSYEAKFYTSTDGLTFTLLGSTVTGAATSIYAGASSLKIGQWTTTPATGTMRRAIVRNGIAGPVVAEWDGRAPSTRRRDGSGNDWTVVGTPVWV